MLSHARAEEPGITPATIRGHYVIGSGPSATELKLFDGGSFIMASGHNFSGEREVRGRWQVNGSGVTLSSSHGGRPYRWSLEAFRHGEDIDLVPEEMLDVYRDAPSNVGSRYRRLSAEMKPDSTSPDVHTGQNGAAVAGAAAAAAPVTSLRPQEVKKGGKAASTSQVSQSVQTKAIADTSKAESGSKAPRGASAYKTVFVSMPAPTTPLDSRGLDEGLARLSLDERGNVTAARILRSTGRAQFDNEALDTFRRWRANPGPAREVDVTITSVLAGKPLPFRVPTTSGSMTSG